MMRMQIRYRVERDIGKNTCTMDLCSISMNSHRLDLDKICKEGMSDTENSYHKD
jgi:hypothetical protein